MPDATRIYRFRVRTPADDGDLLVVTSLPEGYHAPGTQPGAHPYIAAPPETEGATLDPVAGTTRIGSTSLRVIDALLTAPRARLGVDTFEDYANGAADGTAAAMVRPGRWARFGPAGGPSLAHLASHAYEGQQYAEGGVNLLAHQAGSSYIERSDWSEFDLPPDTEVEVLVRVKWINYTGGPYPVANEPKAGLQVEGAMLEGTSVHGEYSANNTGEAMALGYTPVDDAYRTYRAIGKTRSDGTLDVRLGLFDYDANVVCIRDVAYDLVEIWPRSDGAERIVTRVLTDADAEQQLLSRKAFVEVAELADCAFDAAGDHGPAGRWYFPDEIPEGLGTADPTTITTLQAGYVNRAKLNRALVWEFTVGDTERDDRDRKVFAEISAAFGNIGCIAAGPVRESWPGPQGLATGDAQHIYLATRQTRWRVEVTALTAAHARLNVITAKLPTDAYQATFAGEGKVSAARERTAAINAANTVARRYYRDFASDDARAAAINAALPGTRKIWGTFPRLVAELRDTGTGAVVDALEPLAGPERPVVINGLGATQGRDFLVELTASDVYVAWPSTAPSRDGVVVGTQFDLTVFPRDVSATTPLLVWGHVVDVTTAVFDALGIAYDATSAAALTALMPAAYVAWRVTEAPSLQAFLADWVGGPFGIGWTVNAAGERVLFATRIRTPAAKTLTADHLRNADTAVFDLDESSVIAGVDYQLTRFRPWASDDGDRAQDGLVAVEIPPLQGQRATRPDGTPYPYGSRVQTYTIAGFITNATGRPSDAVDFANKQSVPLIEVYGRGGVFTELDVLPAGDAVAGEIVTVEVAHKPGAIVGLTPTSQRGRARDMQVLRRTPRPSGATLRLVEVGPASAADAATPDAPETPALVVPAITLTPSAAHPKTIGTVTLTNGAAVQALGAGVQILYRIGGSVAPTDDEAVAGQAFRAIETVPWTFDLPAVPSGTTVWAKAQLIDGDGRVLGNPPSESAWVSCVLDPAVNGDGDGPQIPAPTITPSVDGSGYLHADITHPTAASMRLAWSTTGPLDAATVRAATTVPATGGGLALGTVTFVDYGADAWIAAFAYDVDGNESLLGSAHYTRPPRTIAGLGPINTAPVGPVLTVGITPNSIGAGELEATGVVAGMYGTAARVPRFIVLPDGRISSVIEIDIGITAAQITDSTPAGRALLLAANAAAQRTALGLGTAAIYDAPAAGVNASSTQLVRGDDTRLGGGGGGGSGYFGFPTGGVPAAASFTITDPTKLGLTDHAGTGTLLVKGLTPTSVNAQVGAYKAAASTPIDLTIGMIPTLPDWLNSSSNQVCGLFVREPASNRGVVFGTGFVNGTYGLYAARTDGSVGWNSDLTNSMLRRIGQSPIYLRCQDDGTNRNLLWSVDGLEWVLAWSNVRTDWAVFTQVGFGMWAGGYPYASRMRVFYWNG